MKIAVIAAIIAVAALLAAFVLGGRYEIVAHDYLVTRLDRLTGQVVTCAPTRCWQALPARELTDAEVFGPRPR